MESILVAVKTTKKTSSEAEKASFMREMTIMSEMMHPNIVRLYGLIQDGKINECHRTSTEYHLNIM